MISRATVTQQWPKLDEPDMTAFLIALMSQHPDAVFCDIYGGGFVTFVKQATPLGLFKAIDNRLIDGGEVGSVDVTRSLGNAYPLGIWANAYDPVIWPDNPPPGHAEFEKCLADFMTSQYASGWAIQGYIAVEALAAAVKKAGTTDNAKVAKAMLGLTFETPIGSRTVSPTNHDFNTGEVWGVMTKNPDYPFAIIGNAKYYHPTVRSREIVDLVTAMRTARLTLAPYFQKNLVWQDAHKRDFIDTILKGFPFPQIFLARGPVDLDTMEACQCVVDGQQRLSTIRDFTAGKLEVGGMLFSELTPRERGLS